MDIYRVIHRMQSYALQVLSCGVTLHSFNTILKTRVLWYEKIQTILYSICAA